MLNSWGLFSNFKISFFFIEILIPNVPKQGKFGEPMQSNPTESTTWLLFPLNIFSRKQTTTSGIEKWPYLKNIIS